MNENTKKQLLTPKQTGFIMFNRLEKIPSTPNTRITICDKKINSGISKSPYGIDCSLKELSIISPMIQYPTTIVQQSSEAVASCTLFSISSPPKQAEINQKENEPTVEIDNNTSKAKIINQEKLSELNSFGLIEKLACEKIVSLLKQNGSLKSGSVILKKPKFILEVQSKQMEEQGKNEGDLLEEINSFLSNSSKTIKYDFEIKNDNSIICNFSKATADTNSHLSFPCSNFIGYKLLNNENTNIDKQKSDNHSSSEANLNSSSPYDAGSIPSQNLISKTVREQVGFEKEKQTDSKKRKRKIMDKRRDRVKTPSTKKKLHKSNCDLTEEMTNQSTNMKSNQNNCQEDKLSSDINKEENNGDGIEYEDEDELKECCGCKKSKCQKLYCDCFRYLKFCVGNTCYGCKNKPEFNDEREEIIRSLATRYQFPSPIKNENQFKIEGKKGCNCKRSKCLKKYCECYNSGEQCNDLCNCINCENNDQNIDKSSNLTNQNCSLKDIQNKIDSTQSENTIIFQDKYLSINQIVPPLLQLSENLTHKQSSQKEDSQEKSQCNLK